MRKTINDNLVWIKGEATGINDEDFDRMFNGITHIFTLVTREIKQNKLGRDNRIADSVRKKLGIDMNADQFRWFYQLCHSHLNPKTFPQRIPFNPHLIKRVVGQSLLDSQLSFNGVSFKYDWKTPEEYKEVNIIPTPIVALEYVADEHGNRTYYVSKLCNELECDSLSDVCVWFWENIKGDNSRKVKVTDHERFGWLPGRGKI